MKAFLALIVRKSVPELTFTKLAFGKSDFLDLVDFDFWDLAKFAMVDRFSIFLPTLPQSTLPVGLDLSCFLAWVLLVSSLVGLSVIWSIKVSGVAILLKFLMNLL